MHSAYIIRGNSQILILAKSVLNRFVEYSRLACFASQFTPSCDTHAIQSRPRHKVRKATTVLIRALADAWISLTLQLQLQCRSKAGARGGKCVFQIYDAVWRVKLSCNLHKLLILIQIVLLEYTIFIKFNWLKFFRKKDM